jgi:ABC-type amino acid transport substrate-binding protein/phage tail protein X
MKMKRLALLFICIMLLPSTSFPRSLEEIKKSGIIRIGTSDIDFRPMHYRDKENNRVGIDIDLINIISNKIGVKLDLVLFKGAEKRMSLLMDDQADLIVSNFSITPARLEQIDFSKAYLTTGIGLMLANKFKDVIREYEDLRKTKITVSILAGSTQHKVLQDEYPNIDLSIYNTSAEAFKAFISGLSDGYSTDDIFLMPTASQNPDKYYMLEGTLSSDPYGVGVNKNNQNLLDQVNSIITEIETNGELKRIIDRHTKLQADTVVPKMEIAKQVKYHTIMEGDTLSKIANEYYKRPAEWKRIYEANKEVLPYPNILKAGVKLVIPDMLAASGTNVGQEQRNDLSKTYSEPILSYIRDLYRRELISKEVYDEINEKGKRYILESHLSGLKEKFRNGDISKEAYEKEQISLLKVLF